MAKQDIYLGVEGNDGNRDSIPRSVLKANENFTELYAVSRPYEELTSQHLTHPHDNTKRCANR